MVELTVLGISLQGPGGTPMLLLYPHGTQKILCLGIGPMEAYAISTALHALDNDAAPRGSDAAPEVDTHSGEPLASGPAVSSVPDSPTPETGRTSAKTRGAAASGADAAREPGAALPKATAGNAEKTLSDSAGGQYGLPSRPMTHDLMQSMMEALGGRLLEVELLRVENGTFFADAVIATADAALRLDCRPSDGVALALRCGAHVRASEAVMHMAENLADVLETLPDHVRTLAMAKIAALAMAAGAAVTRDSTLPGATAAGKDANDFSHVPLVVEAALAARAKIAGNGKKLMITSAGRTVPFNGDHKDDTDSPSSAPAASGPTVFGAIEVERGKNTPQETSAKPAKARVKIFVPDAHAAGKSPASPAPDPARTPTIRLSFVRQGEMGEAEMVEAFQIPPGGFPLEILEIMAPMLSRPGENVSEEERWAALLRLLSPETKVLM